LAIADSSSLPGWWPSTAYAYTMLLSDCAPSLKLPSGAPDAPRSRSAACVYAHQRDQREGIVELCCHSKKPPKTEIALSTTPCAMCLAGGTALDSGEQTADSVSIIQKTTSALGVGHWHRVRNRYASGLQIHVRFHGARTEHMSVRLA
jgi:hypothetical protein